MKRRREAKAGHNRDAVGSGAGITPRAGGDQRPLSFSSSREVSAHGNLPCLSPRWGSGSFRTRVPRLTPWATVFRPSGPETAGHEVRSNCGTAAFSASLRETTPCHLRVFAPSREVSARRNLPCLSLRWGCGSFRTRHARLTPWAIICRCSAPEAEPSDLSRIHVVKISRRGAETQRATGNLKLGQA
jgi:hypothetical protein